MLSANRWGRVGFLGVAGFLVLQACAQDRGGGKAEGEEDASRTMRPVEAVADEEVNAGGDDPQLKAAMAARTREVAVTLRPAAEEFDSHILQFLLTVRNNGDEPIELIWSPGSWYHWDYELASEDSGVRWQLEYALDDGYRGLYGSGPAVTRLAAGSERNIRFTVNLRHCPPWPISEAGIAYQGDRPQLCGRCRFTLRRIDFTKAHDSEGVQEHPTAWRGALPEVSCTFTLAAQEL